jgi:hemoglobin-like flavoprotein
VLQRRNDRFRRHPAPVLDEERRYWIMTLRQIELVQQSFRLIQPIIDDLGVLFYKRLFEIDPSLQPMFHRSRREQARLLAQTLTVVVKQIDQPSQLRREVEALGQRHVGYRVRDEHYAMVGEALLWALEKGLKNAFTSEVRDAWLVAYSWLAFTMQRAAARHVSAGPQTGAPSGM